jgi:tetratricopeptide (TPR) repeat protein
VTNPEELQRQFIGRSTTARWLTFAGATLLLAAGAYFARPAWRALKHWRAASFAQAAADAKSEGNPGLALQHARSALQLQPSNPDYVRLNARLLTELGTDTSLSFWQHLTDRANAAIEDRLAYLEASLAFRRPDLAGPTFSNLLASGPPSAHLQRLGALYHLVVGATNAALTCARAAHQLEPGNLTNALLVASLIPSTADAADRAQSRALLREIAQSKSPLRLTALRRLLHTGIGDRSDREWIAHYLSQLPTRTTAEEVLLAETRVRLDPSTTRHTVSNLITSVPHDDTATLTLVVEALARLGRLDEVMQLTDKERGFLNRSLFKARLDALTSLNLHAEAYQHLLTPGAPMPAFDLALARTQAAIQARDPDRRDQHFAELLKACDNQPDRIRAIAEFAEKQGALDSASMLWKSLGTLPGQTTLAQRSLQRVADRRGDTWTARDHARNALRSDPSLISLRLEIAYYDLLLGENIDAALAQAQSSVDQDSRDFFARAALALAHLRLDQPEKARAAIDRFLLETPQPRHDALAVLAATCGQNGFVVRAQEIASKIPLERLRPEERDLIRPWITVPAPLSSTAPEPVLDPSPGP